MNKCLGKQSLLLIVVLLLALTGTGIAYALTVHTLPQTKLSDPQGWVAVTRAQFDEGVINQTDTSSSPGDVTLATTVVNIASQPNGGVASASSEQSKYPATYVNDGSNTTAWRSKGNRPQWLQINFTSNQTINKMVLYWETYYGIDFKLQIWNGTSWVTVDDVTGNSAFSYTSTFANVTTSKIRYYETDGMHPQKAAYVVEFEAYVAAGYYHYSSGTIASKVYDTGEAGASWDWLGWNGTVEAGVTNIAFEVRASDTAFAKDNATLPWQDASALPISGRYQQWRATLTTSDTSKTPVLHEVRVLYS